MPRRVTFYVYANLRNRRAVIHRADCSLAARLAALWRGPFQTYGLAQSEALQTGLRETGCRLCLPFIRRPGDMRR